MLLSIQFPLADARVFLDNTGRLDVPCWPLPNSGTEFVRFFGSIRSRQWAWRRGLGWANENEYCDISGAVKLFHSPTFLLRETESPSSRVCSTIFRCLHRRLYFDGWTTGKVEVGIGTKRADHVILAKNETKDLLSSFLRFPILLRGVSLQPDIYELGSLGRHLAKLYILASTSTSFLCGNNIESWWVNSGVPLLFIQYGQGERLSLPAHTISVPLPQQYGLKLFYSKVSYNHISIPIWILDTTGSIREKAANLRIVLSRLHMEHESLRIILHNIISNKINVRPGSIESDFLQHYLNTATRRILNLEQKSSQQFNDGIVEIARTCVGVIAPNQAQELIECLAKIRLRKNIFVKIEDYIHQLERGNESTDEIDYYIQQSQAAIDIPHASEIAVGDQRLAHTQLLETRRRRLNILKQQQALYGSLTDPRIIIEIEDIEAQIKKLEIIMYTKSSYLSK